MQQLTEKEAAVLELVREAIGAGLAPSVREICARMGMKSTSTAHRYLNSLHDKGYIIREGNINRAIRLPQQEMTTQVPVVGTVQAGQPILAVENIEEYIPFLRKGHNGEYFGLHVKGDSMINAGILQGDLLIVQQSDHAENGEIVVALIDEEATVKRFFKEDGHFRLQPENDHMEPIIADHITILGKVVGLQRNY